MSVVRGLSRLNFISSSSITSATVSGGNPSVPVPMAGMAIDVNLCKCAAWNELATNSLSTCTGQMQCWCQTFYYLRSKHTVIYAIFK